MLHKGTYLWWPVVAMDFPGDLGYDVAMYKSCQPINQEHKTPNLKIKPEYLNLWLDLLQVQPHSSLIP